LTAPERQSKKGEISGLLGVSAAIFVFRELAQERREEKES
jgi:hypothetical protein